MSCMSEYYIHFSDGETEGQNLQGCRAHRRNEVWRPGKLHKAFSDLDSCEECLGTLPAPSQRGNILQCGSNNERVFFFSSSFFPLAAHFCQDQLNKCYTIQHLLRPRWQKGHWERRRECSGSQEGFCHIFLVDLTSACRNEVSPLAIFSWLLQYLSSHFYCGVILIILCSYYWILIFWIALGWWWWNNEKRYNNNDGE